MDSSEFASWFVTLFLCKLVPMSIWTFHQFITDFMLIFHHLCVNFRPSSSGLVNIYIFVPIFMLMWYHVHVVLLQLACGFVIVFMYIFLSLHADLSLASSGFVRIFFVVLSEVSSGIIKSRRDIDRLKAQYMWCKIASICPRQQKIIFTLLLVGQNITQ